MCSTGCDHKAMAYANPSTIINECSIVPSKDVRKNIANGSDVTSAVITSNGVYRNGSPQTLLTATPTAVRNGVSCPLSGVSVSNGVKKCNNGLERNSLLCSLIDGDLSDVSKPVAAGTVQSVALDALDTRSEGRVLVMYTGGTIGMVKDASGALSPLPNALEKRLRESPIMHDAEYARSRYGRDGPLVLPPSGDSRRVVYTIKEYDPLLDSSNMCVQDWVKIATDIKEHYKEYDGFVILHGTDTLAYTSSALSFMLENLGKTVVVTGSQIPLWELRSDGRDNLILSLVIAGCYVVPEVTVLFGSRLMRGNRTVKVSSDRLAAFDSPNLPPLATIGINIKVDYHMILQPGSLPFTVHAHMSDDIGLIRIFPNISKQAMKSFLQPPLRGAVLLTYGAGNIPTKRLELLHELRAASNRGVILVNCTQCPSGRVSDLYATGKALDGIGVVSGADMTPEAALCKLAYVITKDEWDVETKKEMLRTSLRGELTPASPCPLKECSTLDGMVRALHLELPQTVAILMPALTCAAAARPGASALAALIDAGAVVTACTTEQRTPLHVAAAEGNLAAVRLLLQHGASVHAKDRFGRTPLLDAVCQDRHDVIIELRECGAHLYGALSRFADKICSVAAQGDVQRLKSFHLAGVDLGQRDSSGRTALHVAAETGQYDAVQYLLSAGVHRDSQDADGRTAADLARLRGHHELEDVLRK